MKKSILIVSLIILSLFFSYSFTFAANPGEQIANGVGETAGGVGNAAKDAVNGASNAVKDGMNNLKNATDNASNDLQNNSENVGDAMNNAGNDVKNTMQDAGNGIKNTMEDVGNGAKNTVENADNNMENRNNDAYTVTRTATENNTGNTTSSWANTNMWTWIIIGVITIVIIALIWYYASKGNK
ncbi:MAG: hypothetical protein IKD76_00150 [Clostridia bacterium]|nr:hypothetical protein [Clostridia bacterium]